MVASQSVENEMYPVQSPYHLGEFYAAETAGHYYTMPPDIGPPHMCIHGDYGPVTVPMVSTNSSPPIAMPVQVPPGHVVQQIVDENGTLRHVILSTQHPPGLLPITSHNPQHYNVGPSNGSNGPPQTFYTQGIPQGFHSPHYTHFHTNLPPGAGHPIPTHPAGHSPPPFCKDERTHRRYIKLKKKLHEKQQKGSGDGDGRKDLVNGIRRNKEKGMNSVGTSEDGEESSSVQDEDDLHFITEILSSVQAPSVSELSSRSALLQWSAPARFSETSSSDSHELDISENDLRYEVLLSDKTKEMKYKSIYNGASQSCRIQDLRPGVEYSVRLQVHLDEIQGSASDPLKFTTPACEPDQPQPPKLLQRSKNVLLLRWNPTTSNGSHIIHYVLEYDEGKGGDFVELHKSRGNQHSLQKLTPATCYKFRLAAVNEIGKSVYSDVVAHCTSDNAPQQPDPPKLKRATITSLHLTWHRRPKDDEFNLSMNDPTNTYGYLPLYNGRDNEYVCSDLNRFTDYKFKLRASNEGGNSSWSEEVTFQTLPDRPARPSKPVVKGRIHAHSFRLKWESPSDTGGADISKYILEVNSGSGYDSIYVGTETEAVCDKLTPGTTYQLRVSCESLGGRSNFSDPCTVTTEAISPGQCPVARLHGKAKANSAVIRFTEPDYNGGAPILEYEAEMVNPDSSRILVHKSKEVECNLNNLQPGCEYVFMVRAVNRIGTGPWSEPLAFTSGAAPPDGFNQPTVVCKSPVSACVDWQVPQSNGAQITEYRLEISENNENFHQIYLGPSTTFDVKNLTPFTTYYFRVQASNSAGYGPYSPITATITPAAPPNPIQNPKCEPTATTITLTWNEPQNNGSPITYYNIEIADQVIQTPQPINHYTIQDLQPNTQYRIKLQAVNSVGPSPLSSTQKVTTLRLPPSPPKLECIGIGHNYLKLKWGEGKNPDYTQFSVEMINSRSSEYQCVYKGTAFTCKVNKLQELTTYNFRICASNDAGIGDFSKEYSFVTHIAPPAALKSPKVFDIDSRGCSLEWIPSRASCSDPIEYLVQVSRLKDQQFKQVYKGADTKCTLENLESGAEYCARVCPIRLCQSGELSGPFSPQANFSTPALEPSASSTRSLPTTGTPTHSHRPRSLMQTIFPTKKLKLEQHLVLFKATGVAMVGILLSLLICWFLNMK